MAGWLDGWMYRIHRNSHTWKSSGCHAGIAILANRLAGLVLILPEGHMDNCSK